MTLIWIQHTNERKWKSQCSLRPGGGQIYLFFSERLIWRFDFTLTNQLWVSSESLKNALLDFTGQRPLLREFSWKLSHGKGEEACVSNLTQSRPVSSSTAGCDQSHSLITYLWHWKHPGPLRWVNNSNHHRLGWPRQLENSPSRSKRSARAMVLCCLCLHRPSSAQWVACMRRTAGHLDWAPHIPLSSREPAAQAKTGRSKGWGGWRCLLITSPCLGPVSLLPHSDMPALHAHGRVAQQQHNTHIYLFILSDKLPAHFLLLVWRWTGASEAAGKAEGSSVEGGGGRRGHYHAFASQVFRHEGGLINGDRAGWAITGILLRLSGA